MSNESFAGPEELLKKKKEYLFPCVYHFYESPMQLVRGQGCFLFDHEGKEYLDCYSGVSTTALGHSHPEILASVKEQIKKLVHTTTIYLTQPMLDLAEELARVTPGDLKRSFFCASGSEAVETAVLLATMHTGKPHVIALSGALHGRTKTGMSLTGLEMWRTDPFPLSSVHHIPNPYCFRCPLKRSFPDCDLACADELETVIRRVGPDQTAAVILEPIQGNGGIVVPPTGWLSVIAEIARSHNVLLIADEIQTGFGRTGRMFAVEHEDVCPDILCLSKSLGNGFPISVTLTTDTIAESYQRPGASTYGGNLVSSTAALKGLEIIQREGLVERTAVLGDRMGSRLKTLETKSHHVGEVRGRGLMWGIELVEEEGRPATEKTDKVLEELKEEGILAGKTGAGRNVLTLMPPLVIGEEEIERIHVSIERVLSAIPAGGL